MTPAKFLQKWDSEFIAALRNVADSLEEAGYSVEGPFSVGSEGDLFMTLVVWKGSFHQDKVVDVMWRFDELPDKPGQYWPALEVVEAGGTLLLERNFWDELLELDDDKTIQKVINALPLDMDQIRAALDEVEWSAPRRGARGWTIED